MLKEPRYFEEESLDIGQKNKCKKVNVPNLTVYYVNNCGQTEKDEKLVSYADIKIPAQVYTIKNASEKEIENAREEKTDSDFVFCTFSKFEENTNKILGTFFLSGFSFTDTDNS